jgi:adenylate cyclase
VWGANFYGGVTVALAVFYITERILARRIVPALMEGKQVSDLDGIIPVPIWFRISLLVLTTAILPMTHVYVLNWLGDTDQNLILFFIVSMIAIAMVQVFYILRSISLPIGRIADKFEKFQAGESLPRQQTLYRADDLGRFAEMFEDLVGTIQERDFLQMTFGRYMSQQVMEQIINGQVQLGGEKREATVLFTDVRDFTSLADKREPESIVQLLNDYFERMVKAITDTDGIPDKFIGDGLLAVWGVPIDVENHQQRAVEGAFRMFEELNNYNEERLDRGEEPIEIGTAIHSGELIAGNIGSNKKMEFTVIGDTVNTCNRIESMNKKFNSKLTITRSVYEELSDELQAKFERKPDVEIRGKSEPLTIYILKET